MSVVGTIPPIAVRRDRVIQVLSNLASKRSKVGAPSLTSVWTHAMRTSLHVSDTGPVCSGRPSFHV